ncbi:hypothetical protein EDC04DRAFT_2607563 [Pisolithus marmoratus]|nr:hypothetical protein EDC04DRAFT_2607563 [Pisolithus marmoratus]
MTHNTSTVLVFLMGKHIGPCRMNICSDGMGGLHALLNGTAFTTNTGICTVHMSIGASMFDVYFNKHYHNQDWKNAVYVFEGVHQKYLSKECKCEGMLDAKGPGAECLVQPHAVHPMTPTAKLLSMGAQYFRAGNILVDILHTCDAVISGSTALHMLLPECGMPWNPMDLDIYLPAWNVTLMLNQLKVEGYSTIMESVVDHLGYGYLHV